MGHNGAYTLYTLDKYRIASAFLVDTDFNNAVVKKSHKYTNLKLIKKNFADSSILSQVRTGRCNLFLRRAIASSQETGMRYCKCTRRFPTAMLFSTSNS